MLSNRYYRFSAVEKDDPSEAPESGEIKPDNKAAKKKIPTLIWDDPYVAVKITVSFQPRCEQYFLTRSDYI